MQTAAAKIDLEVPGETREIAAANGEDLHRTPPPWFTSSTSS